MNTLLCRGLTLAGLTMLLNLNSVRAQEFYDPAVMSSGDTGQFGYTSDTTGQGALQQPAVGNSAAPVGQTYNTGTQGWADFNGASLPTAEQGLNATYGYNRPACGFAGSSGFPTNKSRGNYAGASLPPCSTSFVNLHVTD